MSKDIPFRHRYRLVLQGAALAGMLLAPAVAYLGAQWENPLLLWGGLLLLGLAMGLAIAL